jgi:N-acetylmuramoyl-L-alanine amidase
MVEPISGSEVRKRVGNQFTMKSSLHWTGRPKSRQCAPMSAALIAIAALFPVQGAEAAGVQSVAVADREIVVTFDDVVEKASSFILAGPDRIALDVTGAQQGGRAAPAGIVSKIRQSQFDPATTRIVFDLAEPATVASGQFSSDGKALTLALAPISAQVPGSAVDKTRRLYMPPVAHRSAPPRSRYNLTIPLDAPSNGLPRPRIYGPKGRPLVVIDAGHGGHDPGTISTVAGQREKDVTLAIAKRIKDELIASGRVRVALTREDDRFYVLRERSAIARNIGADLFISIHADAAASPDAKGATLYTLSEVASDKEAAALAARENKVDVVKGVNLGGENADVASILIDLAQRETMNNSVRFANLVKREGGAVIPFRTGYHRMAGFAVLKAPDTPAILMEVGYMTNSDDVARLHSPDGQQKIASGLRRAIEIHFARRVASR